MKNIFEDEMKRRGEIDDETYNMIGTEIKRIRTRQSQTLSYVADEVCSVSYLCKIENAKLKPNRYTLNEICKKLNISSPKIEVLFGLKELVKDMVKAFYFDDGPKLNHIYQLCLEFDNYRSKIIEIIYHVYYRDLDKAGELGNELLKIASTMHSEDLQVFMLFYAILNYYQESYLEALDNLKVLQHASSDKVSALAGIYELYCYYKLNMPSILVCGKKLTDSFLSDMDLKKVDLVRYVLGLYALNNEIITEVEVNMQKLQDKSLKDSLKLLLDVKLGNHINSINYSQLRNFSQLLLVYLNDKANYLTTFLNVDKKSYLDFDFSYNIAGYLTLSDDEERFEELKEVIIPNIAQTNNNCEKKFFLRELCRISSNFGRYKTFCQAYAELMGVKNG